MEILRRWHTPIAVWSLKCCLHNVWLTISPKHKFNDVKSGMSLNKRNHSQIQIRPIIHLLYILSKKTDLIKTKKLQVLILTRLFSSPDCFYSALPLKKWHLTFLLVSGELKMICFDSLGKELFVTSSLQRNKMRPSLLITPVKKRTWVYIL